MCLFTKRKSPHVVKRDRRCWKVLYRNDAGKLTSVVYGKEYEPGQLYTEVREPDVTPYIAPRKKPEYYVFGGYMHAFTSVDKAELEREAYSDAKYADGRKPVICECTIPAETEVYTNLKDSEICARSLRIDKIITR